MTNRQYRRRRVTAQFHVEEVRGGHRRGLRVEELPPGRVGVPFRCRADLERLQQTADSGRADPVAELQQLALDLLVTPAGILGGKALDQRGDLGAGRRSSSRWGRIRFRVTRRRWQRRPVPAVTSPCVRRLSRRRPITAARTPPATPYTPSTDLNPPPPNA